jgi:threonine synthase
VLELFHGPTLAFKDVALQFLGRVFEYLLAARDEQLNILGATSGDTGSAAIAGVRGRDRIRIFIMYPHERTSRLQELQMISVLDDNVHNLAVRGSFDDCQAIMKEIFNDLPFKQRYQLGAVNSVNWARVLAQVVYYFYAGLRVGGPTTFSVPTGNFGDIFAGYIAARMGLPVAKLVLATNENDILSVFFNTGAYRRGSVHQTISPSMDIQVASNFERFLFYRFDGDAARVRAFLDASHRRPDRGDGRGHRRDPAHDRERAERGGLPARSAYRRWRGRRAAPRRARTRRMPCDRAPREVPGGDRARARPGARTPSPPDRARVAADSTDSDRCLDRAGEAVPVDGGRRRGVSAIACCGQRAGRSSPTIVTRSP